MSRLMDALQKAQADRNKEQQTPQNTNAQTPPPATRQELWDHVRELEEAFRKREALKVAKEPVPASAPLAAPQTPYLPPEIQKKTRLPEPAPVAAVPEPLEAAAQEPMAHQMEQIQEELIQCEQLASRHAGTQAMLHTQLGAYEALAVQIAQEQEQLKQRLTQAAEAAQSIESTRQFWQKQMDALLACQALSRTVKIVEEELALSRQMARVLAQSQERLVDEKTHYDDRSRQLQDLADRLHQQMDHALAAARPSAENQQGQRGNE